MLLKGDCEESETRGQKCLYMRLEVQRESVNFAKMRAHRNKLRIGEGRVRYTVAGERAVLRG
jgi:hypothetical protein